LRFLFLKYESEIFEVVGRHKVPARPRMSEPILSRVMICIGPGTTQTYLSIRQLRYPLASLRHSSSLTPLLSFRHFRYWEIRCLHSPVDC
jgi:hypothetical protein